MSGASLAALLSRLHSCEEAADLIYHKDAAETLGSATAVTPMAVNSTSAAAGRAELSLIVARRIDTMVARLNDLASPSSQVVLTPRMILCEVMDILRQALFASLPASMQAVVPLADKAGVVRHFNAYVSARQIPVEAAAEALHTVSYVSVKLRVELVALQLRRRIQAELQKVDTQAAEESVAALVVTETLLDDLITIYNNIVLTLPITKAAGAVGGGGSGGVGGGSSEGGALAEAAAERLVPVFEHYFYQLCDWVLVLESTMQGPVMAYTQVRKLTVDDQRGTAVVDLHRPTSDTAWGLLLNERGCLVDIDVSLRVFEKAKMLHGLLQAAPQGAAITRINDHAIPSVRPDAPAEKHHAHAQAVVTALQSATAGRKTVQVTLQSPAFKAAARTMAMEVAFVAPPQGGEGTSGQRVTLVLRRQSTRADWGFTVDDRLYWEHPPLRILSEPARAFVKDYGRHLRLLAVNGVEALHPAQVGLLMAVAETVVLELLVMPSFTEQRRRKSPSSAAAAPSTTTAAAGAAVVAPPPAVEAVVAAPKVKHGSAGAAEAALVEASVAKVLQGSSKAAPKRAAARPVAGATATPSGAAAHGADNAAAVVVADTFKATGVALETPFVDAVMERPSPAAAAGNAVANAATATAATTSAETPKAKRGRPVKPVAAAAVVEEVDQPKAGRGRPKKTSVPAPPSPPPQPSDTVEVTQPDKGGKGPGASTTEEAPQQRVPGESDAACVFDNNVRLVHLTEEEMVLERPSADMPWGLPIGRIADTTTAPQQLPLRLMSLPPAKSAGKKAHPFLASFKKEPATWFIAEVNGKPAKNADTTLKAIGKLTRMTLRFLRK